MPALSDGRMFTSYLSAGQREDMLQRRFGTPNENQYRMFLQHNAGRVASQLTALQTLRPAKLPGPRVAQQQRR